jgi:hypothetical protein
VPTRWPGNWPSEMTSAQGLLFTVHRWSIALTSGKLAFHDSDKSGRPSNPSISACLYSTLEVKSFVSARDIAERLDMLSCTFLWMRWDAKNWNSDRPHITLRAKIDKM